MEKIKSNANAVVDILNDVERAYINSYDEMNDNINDLSGKITELETNIGQVSTSELDAKLTRAQTLHNDAKKYYMDMQKIYKCKESDSNTQQCASDAKAKEDEIIAKLNAAVNQKCEITNTLGSEAASSGVDADTMSKMMRLFADSKCKGASAQSENASYQAIVAQLDALRTMNGSSSGAENEELQKLIEQINNYMGMTSGVSTANNDQYIEDPGDKCGDCNATIKRTKLQMISDPNIEKYCTKDLASATNPYNTKYKCKRLKEDVTNLNGNSSIFYKCNKCETYDVTIPKGYRESVFARGNLAMNNMANRGVGQQQGDGTGYRGNFGGSGGIPMNSNMIIPGVFNNQFNAESGNGVPQGYSQSIDLINNPS